MLFADITWRPAISDPNSVAWCIAAAHLFASWLCFSAGRNQRGRLNPCEGSRATKFWFALGALMFAMCVNKQLDLQTLLTQTGREMAKGGGWYAQRRAIQAALVFGGAVAGATCLAVGLYVLRGRLRQYGIPFLGIVFLLTFAVVRAASFHHVDTVLYHLPLVGNWMNAGLELGGALLVSVGALFASRRLS